MKWTPDSIFRADNARLIEEALDARRRALWLGPSTERDWLIREARYCEGGGTWRGLKIDDDGPHSKAHCDPAYALASGDTIAFVRAIGDMIRAQGVTEVSPEERTLNRSALYVSFAGTMMPNIDRVIRTLAVLQLEIVARPIGRS